MKLRRGENVKSLKRAESKNSRVRPEVMGSIRLRKSGRGQPHSKTLARLSTHLFIREVVECGSPMPLSLLPSIRIPYLDLMLL